MRIIYDIPKLKQIISNIYTLTGLSIDFLDTDHNPLCKQETKYDYCMKMQNEYNMKPLCNQSDHMLYERCCKSKKFECHICYAGCFDAAFPVIKNNVIVGFVIMGRVKSSDSPKNPLYPEDEEMCKLYEEIPYFTQEKIDAIHSLLQNTVFESAIFFDYDPIMDQIVSYIERNIQYDLRICVLCEKFGVSKNYLYREFFKYYGTTINEYITNVRIRKAKELLEETKKPIYEICEDVGINNYTYFCRLFKRETGITPGEYRKENKEW